jgi:hypothetical protein
MTCTHELNLNLDSQVSRDKRDVHASAKLNTHIQSYHMMPNADNNVVTLTALQHQMQCKNQIQGTVQRTREYQQQHMSPATASALHAPLQRCA